MITTRISKNTGYKTIIKKKRYGYRTVKRNVCIQTPMIHDNYKENKDHYFKSKKKKKKLKRNTI